MSTRAASTDLLPTAGQPLEPVATASDTAYADFSEVGHRSFRDTVRILYKYRWLAATCFGVTFGLTILVTLLTPRLYSAATRIQVSREAPIQLQLKDSVLNLDDQDRNVNGTSSFLATQVATLRSRDLAERVIRDHRLFENEVFLRPGSERSGLLTIGSRLLSHLRPRGSTASPARSWDDDAMHDDGGDVPPSLIDRYMSFLDVRDVRGTDLLEIRFTTPSPDLSAMLAAAHTQAYIELNSEAQLATDVTAKEFLGKQLDQSRRRIEQAETALRQFASDHPNVAVNQEQKLSSQRISELTTQITQAEADRIGLQTQVEFLTRRGTDPLPYFLDRTGVDRLHGALLDIKAQRASLDPRLGPNHPRMVELREQEAEVRRELEAEVDQQVAAARAKYDAAQAREDGLRTKLAYVEESAVVLRDLGARYELLKSDVDTTSELHRSLVRQAMETAVSAQLAASNIRVIERAEVPRGASRPNVPLNLTLGLLAAIGLGLAATVVCESLDNSVKSRTEVEDRLRLPMLGTIPNFALARRASPARRRPERGEPAPAPLPSPGSQAAPGALVVLQEPFSPVSEAFRSLRTAVLFSTPTAPPKVILLTSAGAGEGKTVTSLNLAATLAEGGSRVILIDADLRRPSCHTTLGVANTRGLSSFLAGQAGLDEVTHDLERPRLHFVPAGPTPPNPAELVGSTRMREALAELRERYDFLIIDSPPIVPVTDAVVLAREADGVVLVVKGHDTPVELVRRARDQLLLASAHITGAVINNVDMGWGDLHLYNRYYGYYHPHAAGEEAA